MLDGADGFPSFYEGLLVEPTVPWESNDIDYFIAMHTPITRLADGHGVKTLIDDGQRQMFRRKLMFENPTFVPMPMFSIPLSYIASPCFVFPKPL